MHVPGPLNQDRGTNVCRNYLTFWSAVIAIVCAVVIAPTAALAELPPGPHSGNYGPHFLRDSSEFGGARCNYPQPAFELVSIRVRPPSVYAFDRTTAPDSQPVGWSYVIESSSDKLSWSTAATSRAQKGTATESADAPFTARTYTFDGSAGTDYYRVAIRMLWYSQDGTKVRGSAAHSIEYYEIVGDGFPTAVRVEPCQGNTPLVG
jgi:hypothetical protein